MFNAPSAIMYYIRQVRQHAEVMNPLWGAGEKSKTERTGSSIRPEVIEYKR